MFPCYSLIEDQTLKTENIFTILALLNQLTVCLSVFPVTLPIMIKAILSIRRLKSLFSRPDVQVHEGKNEEKTDNSNTQSAISMINATYLWPNSDIKGIDNITTDITKGSLTMVISPNNAFFLSLLKELKLHSGNYIWNLSESISYVGSRDHSQTMFTRI